MLAYGKGGAALAVETVRNVTGVPINHVVLIDFNGFKELVNAVGGVDIYNHKRVSSEFDGDTYHLQTQSACVRWRPRPERSRASARTPTTPRIPTSRAASASSV